MMNSKWLPYKLLSVCVLSAALAACSSSANVTSQANIPTETAAGTIGLMPTTISTTATVSSPVASEMVTYTEDDSYTDWINESPNYIKLANSTATLQGIGAVLKGNTITIALPGVYVFSGSFNGQVVVDLESKGTVKLVLNGAEITSSTSAAIFVKSAKKTIVSLQEGTQNMLSDARNYVLEDGKDEPNAALYSKDDLTINGAGALIVHGNYNNGIVGKDDLKITGGNIQIDAVDDGLIGRDMLAVRNGIITIEAKGDGIRSTNDENATKGFIVLQGGTYNIKAGADGIQAVTSALITDGKYTITTGGGSANAPAKAQENFQNQRGMNGRQNQTTTTPATAETASAKGIKAGADITISGGTIAIDSADDSVHSNNTLTIAGGSVTVASGDDGLHADTSLTIQDGVINITKSYEGIESKLITIAGGHTTLIASDDGVNGGGGNDGSAVNGRPGQNSFSTSGESKVVISGGYLSIDASGDGLDSNGSIEMSGGTVVVSGPTTGGNGALDYDSTFTQTGGTLIAAGSAGMAQAPSETSAQYSILMSYSSVQAAGTLAVIQDGSGKTIAAVAPKKQYQTLVITTPDMKKDGTYTLYTGGAYSGTATDGLYGEGAYQNGTKIVSFMVANPVTYLSPSGVTTGNTGNQMGGGGGRMNQGFGGGGQAGGGGQGRG